jgi:hypothetical protein
MVMGLSGPAMADSEPVTVPDSEAYFQDAIGNRWEYRGHVSEGPMQTIADKIFLNSSTVTGTTTLKGVAVKVFHDSNAGNHGPSDSYYRRDPVGIVYYGSEPGSSLDRQLTPYQIMRFPVVVPSSFQQFNRKDIDFGVDLDGDGENERADVEATVHVLARESVTVPAQTYPDALKVEARMRMHIRFTTDKRTAIGTDTMTAWFARDVGLVKYVEYQQLPAVKGRRGVMTEIVEELVAAEVKSPVRYP